MEALLQRGTPSLMLPKDRYPCRNLGQIRPSWPEFLPLKGLKIHKRASTERISISLDSTSAPFYYWEILSAISLLTLVMIPDIYLF
jgi:hypothetical protein